MPVSTRQSRDGEAVKIPWTFWHFGILLKEFPELTSKGFVDVTETKCFAVAEDAIFSDGTAGEMYVWEIRKGDTLEMWR